MGYHTAMREIALERQEEDARGFGRIVELLIWLVILPTAALLAVGVLMMVFWQARLNLLFGILVVTLVGCLTTGAVLAGTALDAPHCCTAEREAD